MLDLITGFIDKRWQNNPIQIIKQRQGEAEFRKSIVNGATGRGTRLNSPSSTGPSTSSEIFRPNPITERLMKEQTKKIVLHSGFHDSLYRESSNFGIGSKFDHIMKKVYMELEQHREYRVEITGLSLGGALSQMFSLYAAAETNPLIVKPITCFSFASPKIGALSFRRSVQVMYSDVL